VFIRVDGAAFGTLKHGFTITNARREGLLVQASGVTVAGNMAIANGTNGNDAFSIDGTGNAVIDNVAINNGRASGFTVPVPQSPRTWPATTSWGSR
jgi:hypothetical protein